MKVNKLTKPKLIELLGNTVIERDHLQSQLKEAEQVIKTISELNHWDNTVSEMRELADTYLKIHNQTKEDENTIH